MGNSWGLATLHATRLLTLLAAVSVALIFTSWEHIKMLHAHSAV